MLECSNTDFLGELERFESDSNAKPGCLER